MGLGLVAGPGIGGWPGKPCMFWYPWSRCGCCWFEGNIWLLFNSDWRWLSWWLFRVVFIADMSPAIQAQGNVSQYSFQQSGGIPSTPILTDCYANASAKQHFPPSVFYGTVLQACVPYPSFLYLFSLASLARHVYPDSLYRFLPWLSLPRDGAQPSTAERASRTFSGSYS